MGSSDNRAAAARLFPGRAWEHAQQAGAAFAERFGRRPTLAAFAPGRVNLIGEHTDYNQGFALPMAIERYTIVVADRHDAPEMVVNLRDVGQTLEVHAARPIASRPGAAGNHILGVSEQFRRAGAVIRGVDALVSSTVPIGRGLSSSASIEVAWASLLERLTGRAMSEIEKARICQAAEHEFAGTPCGIIDMLTCIAARADHALLIDCRSNEYRLLRADFAAHGVTLLVVDSGVHRELARSAYAERRETCAQAAAILGRPSLRCAAIEDLDSGRLTRAQRMRALHVISENTRTVLAAEALALGNLARLGELMFDSHASLRDLFQVSCEELDLVVSIARRLAASGDGVLGARMTGAGFGGCAIVLCASAALESVQARITGEFAARFGHPPAMFTTAAAAGAGALEVAC
jgi:galactokinase